MRFQRAQLCCAWRMNLFVAGLLAGLIATVPMTLFMVAFFYRLPRREQYPLPPREVTMEVAERTGLDHELAEPQRKSLTLTAHFAYGTIMGGIYALFAERIPAPGVAKGILFGLLVWAGSYLVLLPALGILRSATKHPLRRNALMISAHAVWGAVLGLLTEALRRV
jgi:uncharacterized membrane protein YagU involved in acid resistance